MDTIGPITRSVQDAAALLQVIAGFDPLDAITLRQPVPNYSQALHLPIAHLRIGIPREYFYEQLHPDVASSVESAIGVLKSRVRQVKEVKLPLLRVAENGTYDVELYHFQKPYFDKNPQLYHPWSQRQMNELKKVETVPYVETLKRVRECRRDIRKTFEEADVLLVPTMREPAPLISETENETHKRLPSNTAPFNHFGTPALTVPCGFSKERLPIGLEIIGPAYGEPVVLSLGYAYQQATDWHKTWPSVVTKSGS
jgi:aspartyl-tRNA(Asn)/glutamyl-tRNA(Gln) amidotransferase subunit A